MANKGRARSRVALNPKSTSHRLAADPKQLKIFYDAIANGLSVESSAHLADFRPRTIEEWLIRGRAVAASGLPPEPGSLNQQHLNFLRGYEKARSSFEARHVSSINSHSIEAKEGQWRASAWMLERRRPDTYGDPAIKRAYFEAELGRFLELVLERINPNAARELLDAVRDVLGRDHLVAQQTAGVIDRKLTEHVED